MKILIRNEDIASSERCERSEQSDDKIRKKQALPSKPFLAVNAF